jgi:hypothetical protein
VNDQQKIAERLKEFNYGGIAQAYAGDPFADLAGLLAHVETLTQQVAELTEQRDAGWRRAEAAESDWQIAEQQRDAAHAALTELLEAHGPLDPKATQSMWARAKAALAVSAPQKKGVADGRE